MKKNGVRRTIELSKAAAATLSDLRIAKGLRSDTAAMEYAIAFARLFPNSDPKQLEWYVEICSRLGEVTSQGAKIVIKYPDREEGIIIIGLPKRIETQPT